MAITLRSTILLILTSLLFSHNSYTQNKGSKATYIGKNSEFKISNSLVSRSSLILMDTTKKEALDGRSSKGNPIPGKGSIDNDKLVENSHRLTQKIPGRAASLVFDAASPGTIPTDPSIAVGPNHVFVVFNLGFRIFDKNGTPLTDGLAIENIFSNGGCCDLTVSYDNAADRWVISYLFASTGSIQVAVSQDPNPLTTAWNVYTIPNVDDYNKLSVWSDAYYISGNINNADPSVGQSVFALDRAAMLDGNPDVGVIGFPLPGISTNGFYSPQFLNVSNDDLPAIGGATIVYQQDDAFSDVTFDHLNLWTIDVDFDTPTNSTISAPLDLPTTDFISVFDGGITTNLTQPNGGSDIDALQGLIANQAQFRSFPTHNSAVFSFVVDVDGTQEEQAGIRWFELRQNGDNQPWSIFQEGTYTSTDGKHAWNASMIMDSQGNIGMGYTAMGGTTDTTLSSYYTGRFANDPLGTMTISETLIQQGTDNLIESRYGDYSKIDVDPIDDRSFWFINEIVSMEDRTDVVGVFQIAAVFDNDLGIVNTINPRQNAILTATEDITVDIFNFGNTAVSNFNVTYQINGGNMVTETFTETLAPMTSAQYTFVQTADLSAIGATFNITSCTALSEDQDISNDCETITITNAEGNDLGVSAITSPTSSLLGTNEVITITIENFGVANQTVFNASYTLDGGTPIVETVNTLVNSGETISYSFTQTADLSISNQSYQIIASTILNGDANPENDSTTINLSNALMVCEPTGGCSRFNDGVTEIQLVDQDLSISCGEDIPGYSDDRNIIFNFDASQDIFNGTLQTGFNNSDFVIWIDFNDNGIFESSEIVSQADVTAGNTDFDFTVDLSAFNTNERMGSHIMRIRGEDSNRDGESEDPCGTLEFGRTNDYTAFFDAAITIEDTFEESHLSIIEVENKIFEISLRTDFEGESSLNVFNIIGQQVLFNTSQKEEGSDTFSFQLDMSFAASGVYIIQFKGGGASISKKILVR